MAVQLRSVSSSWAEKRRTKLAPERSGSATSAQLNAAAAQAFIDYILRPDVGAWVAENILYKVPNAAAMESLDPALIEAVPNLGMTPEELFENEVMRDVGDAQPTYTRIVSEVTAS